MPKLKVDKIVSFSSEDTAFPASNLLCDDPVKKWKCCSRGEDAASVVLQLEQATKISAIDIGNEHSAYIEILVNRSSSDLEDFKLLLATSSFMSALDSRQSININKVRMFPHDQLSKPGRDEKWDRIKVVCTQPFNKHVQYGISFITFHSTEVKEHKVEMAAKTLGKFTLRPESPPDFVVGSLFANRNDTPAPVLTVAAAIRQAANSPVSLQSKSPLLNKLKQSKESNPSPSTSRLSHIGLEMDEGKKKRDRKDILYTKDDEDTNEKIDKLIAKKVEEKEKLEAEKKEKEKQDAERKEREKITKIERTKKLQELSDKKTHKAKKYRFDSDDDDSNDDKNNDNGLIANNTVDTSPNKLNIRNHDTLNHKRKASDNGITHNNKMKKKMRKQFHILLEGVVFTISGIQNPDRADLRRKALTMGAKYKGGWDSSCTHLICAFVNTPKFLQVRGKGKIVTKHWILECHSNRKRLPWRRYALDRNDYGSESEEEVLEYDGQNSEESDHEEPVASTSTKVKVKPVDNISPSTSLQINLPELPSFFSNKNFYVDESLSDTDKQMLTKYIRAYDGTILDDLSEAKVIITSVENVVNIKSKCLDDVAFVCSDWIWECHNLQRCVSPTEFLMM